ncbi:MAG TPA: hypothetical protein DIU00_00255 [Phycisphaerales bacterium]|nr:hypothetical protein [Phycisphaerales bacterium]
MAISMSTKKSFVIWTAISLLGCPANHCRAQEQAPRWPDYIQVVLDSTRPLEYDRGERLPLYLWQAMDPGPLNEKALEELIKELNKRGVGLISSWNPGNRQKSLAQSLMIAKAQEKLNLRVNINANQCLYSFFNGDEQTAHIDGEDKHFWDESFGKHKMGCPFALDFRRPYIREQAEYFVKAFNKADLDVDFIFADWEIDGPIEFNEAHAASKRCRRCRENIKNIDDFEEFQKALRQLRCELQREVYAEPVKNNFPGVLVGNYGVYPHNGYRYWYDYYEYYVDGQPCLTDQRASYRKWYDEFPETGYTFAMPVVYTWQRIFDWYDYADTDYRWFYNMLLVASNAGEHTPAGIPVISFVHWHTIEDDNVNSKTVQFSEDKYKELLWHMLLRGTDTFFLWCRKQEAAKEIRLVHEVYAEAQRYGRFLSEGTPINFNVPRQPGTIVSGLKLSDRVLLRRTDFGKTNDPVEITIDNMMIKVAVPEGCQVILLR